MQTLTIVGLFLLVCGLYYRVFRLTKRLEETRQLTAGALDSHTTALERFSGRLKAVEYPKYMGTEIGVESECETPENVHYQKPRRSVDDEHDARVAAALESPIKTTAYYLPEPETSPFFTKET